MASEYNWPKPWLLDLYSQAVEEGCIRIVLRGQTPEACEAEWKSFRAAFLRLRRKKDANYFVQMRPEFQFVQLRYEPHLRKVLIMYSALPDDQLLPTVESVEGKKDLPQPVGSRPHDTPEESVEDFDPTAHVAGLINNLNIEGEDDGGTEELG